MPAIGNDIIVMPERTPDNNLIAKNTILLYARMLTVMLVQLYTSRIVLNALGVIDYGIYNVVGGIVIMFGFLNGSMTGATQRYIAYELGTGNVERLKSVFRAALQLHILISIIVVVLAESIGLWLLYSKMQIPTNRILAAFWVFQCSVISFVINILAVPYNATIIAHEKMSAFAYISVLEVILKLLSVFILIIIDSDRLIIYAVFILIISCTIRFCYTLYCHRHFEETIYRHTIDGSILKEMVKFGGWNMVVSFVAVVNTQGINILLNIFFGPVVNAARGIAVQVQMALNQFCNNFQMAVSPELTKTVASMEYDEALKLMFRAGRFSFYLLFMVTLPMLIETEKILSIWLVDVPTHSSSFLRILLCCQLIWTFSGPMSTVAYATGKIDKLNMTCGLITLSAVPVSWFALKIGAPAYSVFVVITVVESVSQLVRMLILKSLIMYSIRRYVVEVYFNALLVAFVSLVPPLLLHCLLESSIVSCLIVCVASVLSVSLSSFFIGMTGKERQYILGKVCHYYKRLRQ